MARYEDLRRWVLDGEVDHGMGRALLTRQGMAVWIETCVQCVAGVPAPTKSCERLVLPAGLHGEVVRLLVEMALGVYRQEAAG